MSSLPCEEALAGAWELLHDVGDGAHGTDVDKASVVDQAFAGAQPEAHHTKKGSPQPKGKAKGKGKGKATCVHVMPKGKSNGND